MMHGQTKIEHLQCLLDWEDVCASENVPLGSSHYEYGGRYSRLSEVMGEGGRYTDNPTHIYFIVRRTKMRLVCLLCT